MACSHSQYIPLVYITVFVKPLLLFVPDSTAPCTAWSVQGALTHSRHGTGSWFTCLDPRPAHHGKLLAAFNARLGLRLGARAPADTIDVPPRETHQDAARHRLRDAPPRAHAAPPRVEARAEGQVAAEEEESGGGAKEHRGEPRPLAIGLWVEVGGR